MSIAFEVENPELAQFDPARAGIFNPENRTELHDPLSNDVADIVNTALDYNTTANTLSGVSLTVRQLLMVGAFTVSNGQSVFGKEIFEPFPGLIDSNKNSFNKLVTKIGRSKHSDILQKQLDPTNKTRIIYKWAETAYDPAVEDEVQELFWRRIEKLGTGIAKLRLEPVSKEVTPLPQDKILKNQQTYEMPLLEGNEEEDWQKRALCAQTDSEAFFPDKGGSTREAKKVCLKCDVRDDCLEYALINEERFGIWGGLSERERRKILKSKV